MFNHQKEINLVNPHQRLLRGTQKNISKIRNVNISMWSNEKKNSQLTPNYILLLIIFNWLSSIHNIKEECFIHLSLPQSHKVLNNKTF